MYHIRVKHTSLDGGYIAIGINRQECLEMLKRKFPKQDYKILEEGLMG